MSKLDGKVALISGSGRGIGRALALKLAHEGARVVVNDLDADPAQAVIEEIQGFGGEAVACTGDVTTADFGTRFVKTALDSFGSLDIIVNNAGYTWDSVIQKMSDEQFEAMVQVHLMAPYKQWQPVKPLWNGHSSTAKSVMPLGNLLVVSKTLVSSWPR